MKVGVLGTGLMGAPMAERLLQAGHEVFVYNRSTEKAAPLAAAGACVCASAAQAVAQAECVLLMLADAPAIEAVLLSAQARAALPGRSVIQMGTIAPQESRRIAREVETAGGAYLEAPVLGSIPEARAGRLLLMVGAAPEQYARWRPLLQVFGPEPVHVGPVGQGAALKLAMNQLIASLTTGFALSLGLVRREGVEVETFMRLLRDSALYAPTFDKKLGRMLARDYARPNFPLKHLLKDLRLCLQAAEGRGLETEALHGVEALLLRALELGLAEVDYSALYEAVDPPAQP